MAITPYRPTPYDQLSQPRKLARKINEHYHSTSPATIVLQTTALTALAYLIACYLYNKRPRPLRKDTITILKFVITFIPKYRQKIEAEYAKFRSNLEAKIFAGVNPNDILTHLPAHGMSREEVLQRYKDIAGTTHNGKNTGAVYCSNPAVSKTGRKAAKMGALTNPIHLNLAPLIRQIEAEACSMVAKMFRGDDQVRGNITSGGTESIHHAVYAARERAKSMGITKNWEMILPVTAHPAFRKSAHQLCIKVIDAPVHPERHVLAFQVDVKAIEKHINNNTILVVGSLPDFPHGMCDPIEKISDMLETKDPRGYIGLHVDSCLGGFVIPFMAKAGFTDGPSRFGFDVRRVTSISADTHKYGEDEKGSSVILFRDTSWKRHLVYVDKDWPGGIYATPTLPGSRPGSVILRVHAVMSSMGEDGYVEQTRKLITLSRQLITRIRQNLDLIILGNPKAMVFAFTFQDPQHNIHDLNAKMTSKGWYFSGLQKPNAMHFCVTPVHAEDSKFVETFMNDLTQAIAEVKVMPPEERSKSGDARTYASNERMDESMFVEDFAVEYWNVASQLKPTTFSPDGGVASSSS